MFFLNLTPHHISVINNKGQSMELSPSGQVARVSEAQVGLATLGITRRGCGQECGGCGVEMTSSSDPCNCESQGIPWEVETFISEFGEVTGLPEPKSNWILVVSGMVAAAAPREDVMSPGVLVRNENGQPIGCRGLRRSR